jgi:hypothetical protein
MEWILGVIVSLFVEWAKRTFGTDVFGTYIVVLVLSFVAAVTYVYLKDTALWPVLVQIVTVAGSFYAFVLARFKDE